MVNNSIDQQLLLTYVMILYCDKSTNRIGHKLLQFVSSPLLTCIIHIIYNDNKIIEQQKTTIYAHGNLGPGLGQAQECGGD